MAYLETLKDGEKGKLMKVGLITVMAGIGFKADGVSSNTMDRIPVCSRVLKNKSPI